MFAESCAVVFSPPYIMLKKALTHSDRSKDRSLDVAQWLSKIMIEQKQRHDLCNYTHLQTYTWRGTALQKQSDNRKKISPFDGLFLAVQYVHVWTGFAKTKTNRMCWRSNPQLLAPFMALDHPDQLLQSNLY